MRIEHNQTEEQSLVKMLKGWKDEINLALCPLLVGAPETRSYVKIDEAKKTLLNIGRNFGLPEGDYRFLPLKELIYILRYLKAVINAYIAHYSPVVPNEHDSEEDNVILRRRF